MSNTAQKETWFCGECGSTDIRHDAMVALNPDSETWEVLGVLDNTWCEDCSSAASAQNREDTGDPVFGIPGEEQEDGE